MQKNDVVTVLCERLGSNGEGVCRQGDVTLFVPYLIPGEKASVRILAVKEKVAYGKVLKVLTPAEERVRPVCGVFGKCGGCQLSHMRYRAQINFKTELVKNTLEKIGGIRTPVSPCVRSDKEYGYRNKLILPIGNKDGELAVGFFAERSHRIVGTDDCPITPWANKVIAALKTFASACGLDGYDELTGTGQLRHIVIREIDGQYLVVLVVTEEIKGIDYLISLLGDIFPRFSLFLNFNTTNTNVIFGKEFRLLKGKETYEGVQCGIAYEAGAETFLQVNADVRSKLYECAAGLVGEEDTVIDCYSGGGLMTAMFAQKCRHAYGIESVKQASACADRLKEKNGLSDKMTNVSGRVEEELPALLKQHRDATLVLDPPRAGMARSVLSAVIESGAKRVIVISCNPATLARDLGILTGSLTENERGELVKEASPNGVYVIEKVQPFDMFPQTKHVETLVALSRRDS